MDYSYFLRTHTADKWNRIGIDRRAGVVVPLFSVYSEESVGIGEIPDIKLLVKWCRKTGISIIQLLPLNDVGNDFAPYSSVSTFALDPMYLSIKNLTGVDIEAYEEELTGLKKKARPMFGRVNYKVKELKLKLLWKIFKKCDKNIGELNRFIQQNEYWLRNYTLYKVICEYYPIGWDKWNPDIKNRNPEKLAQIESKNFEKIHFHCWLQWQLFEQMKSLKHYASQQGVYIMGDLPFLVSKQSADVWAHQDYFMTDLSAGAPPDMYFAFGQKWGMPPYNWDNIVNQSFAYLKEKLRYAENFYDMYRIDHFVGLFRVWVTPNDDEIQKQVIGTYMPKEEYMWENHGRKIIDVMAHSTSMLPCAEDLGTVPGCSYHVLYEYGIPGIDFQRYYKLDFKFNPPNEYRINSQAVVSTHDSSFFANWWQFEAGTIDEKLFEMLCEKAGLSYEHYRYAKHELFDKELSTRGRLYWRSEIKSREVLLNILRPPAEKANDFVYLYMESYGEKKKFLNYLGFKANESEISTDLVKKCLEQINQSASIISIQLLHEYLCLDEELLGRIGRWHYRINTPGKVSKNNWSQLLPVSLEELLELEINPTLKEIFTASNRR